MSQSLQTHPRPHRFLRILIILALLVPLLNGATPSHVNAATAIVVDTLADELNNDGDCSLREAITAANTDAASDQCPAGSGIDTISFSVSGVISLTSQLPSIGESLNILGPGAAQLTISGNNAVRIFIVPAGVSMALQGFTLANGFSTGAGAGGGGAIRNSGGLVINEMVFRDNQAAEGAAIRDSGVVTILASTFISNTATNGGALFVRRNTALNIANSTFAGNSASLGGAIYASGVGSLTFGNNTFVDNKATQGGAIYNTQATVTLVNTVLVYPAGADSCQGTIIDGGNNLDAHTDCGFSAANNSFSSTDPLLGPLSDNGGPTQTYLPQAGSPLIDNGDDAACANPQGANGVDQRGVIRPQGPHCDIGAVEVVPPATPTPTETPTETPTDTPTDTPTFTPTDTPTDTPTATATDTPVDTPTFTPTPTPSDTPTDTDTPPPGSTSTPTFTPTATPTDTDTPPPGSTFTPTFTPTATPTATETPPPGSTATFTPTPTETEVLPTPNFEARPRFSTNGAIGTPTTLGRSVAAPTNLPPLPPSLDDRGPDYTNGFNDAAAVDDVLTITNESNGAVWGFDSSKARGGLGALGASAGGGAVSAAQSGPQNTWMSISNPIDLRGAKQADVEFYVYFNIEPEFDSVFVGVSVDNQTFYGETWSGVSGGWQYIDIDLSEYLGQPKVYVTWVYQSNGSNPPGSTYEGVWLDDLKVWTYLDTPPVALADTMTNGDFETGDLSDWTPVGGVGVVAEDSGPGEGAYVVSMGGQPNANDLFYQALTVPDASTALATFSFNVNLFGQETQRNVDLLCVALYGELNGAIDLDNRLIDLGCLDGIDAYNTAFNPEAWLVVNYPLNRTQWTLIRGQNVYAAFELHTNADLNTTAYLDNIAVQIVTGGSPGDASEPNDAISEAAPIPLSTPLNGLSIDPDFDVDAFRVEANAGDRIVVNVDAAVAGSPLDASVRVRDANNQVVCQNDDDEYTSDPFVVCAVPATGPYFVEVTSYTSNGDRSDTYTLQVDVVPPGGQPPANPTPQPTPTEAPPKPATWTAMLYMDGDTNLCGAYPTLIQRIEQELGDKIGPGGFVNVLVLLDRIPSFCTGDGSTTRYLVQPGAQYIEGINRWGMGEKNMADPNTLIDFVDWSMRNYPAERYYLAIDDHGSGVSGISWDDTARTIDNKSDYLTNAELYSALKTITHGGERKLDVLAYEACLMGLYESAYDARRFADTLFFFPTINYTNSASYPSYIKDERFQPTTDSRAFGEIMFDVYWQNVTTEPYAMSLVDTAGVDALQTAIDAWANALISALPTNRDRIAQVRYTAQKVDSNADERLNEKDVLLDVWDLADRLAQEGIAVAEGNAVKAAVDATMIRIAQRSSRTLDYRDTHGLTIYWPQTTSGFLQLYVDGGVYSASRNGRWDDFLAAFFSLGTGRPGLEVDPGPIERRAAEGTLYLPFVMN